MNNYILYKIMDVTSYPCPNLSWSMLGIHGLHDPIEINNSGDVKTFALGRVTRFLFGPLNVFIYISQ